MFDFFIALFAEETGFQINYGYTKPYVGKNKVSLGKVYNVYFYQPDVKSLLIT